jgi:predicted PurR-regulated permease PerM
MNARVRRVVFPVVAVVVVLILARTVSPVLSPVLFAALLAVILNPAVEAAARFRLPRAATVSLLYVIIVLVAAVSTAGLGGQFASLVAALQGEPVFGDHDGNGVIELVAAPGAPPEFDDQDGDGVYDAGALAALRVWITVQRERFSEGMLGGVVDELGQSSLDLLEKMWVPATEMLTSGIDRLVVWAGGFFQLLTLLVLVPFYLFFFLVEYPSIVRKLHELVPPRHREVVTRIARDVGAEQVAFLRGRLSCGLVKALMLWTGMLFLGLELALPIALVSGLLSLVPFLGFLVGVIPASVIALTMPGGGTESLLWLVSLFVAAEALEGAVLFPLLLGRETGLHPVTMVVVLLAGGALLGTLGVLVAVPLALICKVLWREIGLPFYLEWAVPDVAGGAHESEAGGLPDDAAGNEGPSQAP